MRKTLKRNLAYDDRNHLYYVSLYYDGENGRRVRRTRTYQTMEQAEQVIADYRRAQLLGGKSAPRDVSMEDWLRYWMREIITPNCAETTRHGYENILYTHMIPTLGKVYVQELTAMRVQQYYGELRKKGLANNTIRKHHVLHRLHREWEQRRKENGAYNPEGYVAVNKAGKPYQPDILCRRIAQFIAEQGLPPISLHGLRHSFASVANSQNVPMFSISKALGHSSTSVTSAVYMHLFDDAVADVVSQVASAITGKEP